MKAPNKGQRELRTALRFLSGKTVAGHRWLKAKRRNRLAVLSTGVTK